MKSRYSDLDEDLAEMLLNEDRENYIINIINNIHKLDNDEIEEFISFSANDARRKNRLNR